MAQMKAILTAGQIEFFHRQGYLAIDQLTASNDVDFLRKSYDRIFADRAGREEGNHFDLGGTDEEGTEATLPQILNPAKYAPEINDSMLLKNASIAVRQLLGEEASCRIAHAIYKPPRIGAKTPWHQDAAYWDPNKIHNSVSIWVPLQEATPENGCMHFIPQSHTWDVLEHQSIDNDPRIHGLELSPESRQRVKASVACPLPPGGATIHTAYTLHYAGPNRAEIPRRAIILVGSTQGQPRKTPRSFPWMEEKRTARHARKKAMETQS